MGESRESAKSFDRLALSVYFDQIVAKHLGDRSHLTVPDNVAFPKIMAVIWTGASHREVADLVCSEKLLIERHKEWAASTALPEFLLRYLQLAMRAQGAPEG